VNYKRILVKLLGVFTVETENISTKDSIKVLWTIGAIAVIVTIVAKIDINAIIQHFLK
jgi:hypothetical protein